MATVLVAVGLMVVAVVVALVIQARTDRTPARGRWPVPTQIHAADLPGGRDVAVLLFSSATCDTCEQVRGVLAELREDLRDAVGVADVSVQDQPAIHERYGVEAVPTLVVADAAGVVRASWVGPVRVDELEAALGALVGPADQG